MARINTITVVFQSCRENVPMSNSRHTGAVRFDINGISCLSRISSACRRRIGSRKPYARPAWKGALQGAGETVV